MNDLLSQSFHGSATPFDIETGDPKTSIHEKTQLAHFNAELASLDGEMAMVKDLLSKLEHANEESKSVTTAASMKALRQRMDSIIKEVLNKAKFIKLKLEGLDKANLENRHIPGCEKGSTEDRMRMNITNNRRSMLKALMESFDQLRQKIRGEYRETIERRYYAITGEKPSQETIDSMIETGESETFLQKAVREQGRGQILSTIEEIKERHDAVQQVEKNLLELHQIFLDMAVLVDAQGEQLISIEENVLGARSFVDRGNVQLRKARRLQLNSRKCTCIALIILLIIIIIAVVLLINYLKK